MSVRLAERTDPMVEARERLGDDLFGVVAEAVRLLFAAEERPVLIDRREAARRVGVSLSHFQRHVQPHLPCVYSGQLRLYRPADIEVWAAQQAVLPAGR